MNNNKENILKKLKCLLLEATLINSNLYDISSTPNSVNAKIRKLLRLYAKAESFASIIIKINSNLKPTTTYSEKSYWYMHKATNYTKIIMNHIRFDKKPNLFYHYSDYRVEVGDQWLIDVIQKKD